MDLSNLLDIYTLQYLFLPRINAALKQFITMWNNHKLSSENSHTPLQLLHFDSSRTAMVPNEEEQNEFIAAEEHEAVEEKGAALIDVLAVSSVLCEPIECPLNSEQLLLFHARVQPISTMEITFEQMTVKYSKALVVIYDIYYDNNNNNNN